MATKTASQKKPAKAAQKPATKIKAVKPPAKSASAKPAPAKKTAQKPVPQKPAPKTAKPVLKVAPKKAEPAKKPEPAKKADLKAKTETKAKSAPAPVKKGAVSEPVVKKPDVKLGAKPKPGEEPQTAREDADSPLLDMSDVGVRKMIARAKTRGYVTYDELNKVLPSDKVSSEQIEDTMSMLNEMGINVIESEEQEEGAEGVPALAEGGKEVTAKAAEGSEQYDRTDDPVRMYLREMGSVELLSREGEIAIAKRIEAGRELMIGALCESPLTFEAITVWRDELNDAKVLLRDIIDLEAMYGAGPDGQPQPPTANGEVAPGMPAAPLMNGHGAPAITAPPPRPPEVRKPEPDPNAEPLDPAEVAAAADAAADEEDEEGNLPLSAMEAALKPQVLATLDQIASLYKKLGKLQDASVEAAIGGTDELSNSQERRFKKLRSETVDLVKGLKLNNNRIEALVDQMYGINRRLISLEGAHVASGRSAWRGPARFPERAFRQRARSQLGAPRGALEPHRLEGIHSRRARQGQFHPRRDSDVSRRKCASRSAISAASCKRCKRANANRARRKRK